MHSPAAFVFSGVHSLSVVLRAGLRLRAWACGTSSLRRRNFYAWAAPVFESGRSLLAIRSNSSLKPTRLRRAAYLGR
ncbi:DUF1010 domain-containing protein [Xylophilus sp.]|uniref:DUF1010 domain-containing protein n=1 Tax=Xylophilus sp. TaxID=2653893 RepID=UPI002D7FF52E|nr:DUF1010 domain-containing protein [Xylophilus sp.]